MRSPIRRSAPRDAVRLWSAGPSWCSRCGTGCERAWGPARDVRDHQPLMALGVSAGLPDRPGSAPGAGRRARCLFGGGHRHVHRQDLQMDPRIGDGGRGYRRRVASLIAAGRAYARFSSTARWCSRPRWVRSPRWSARSRVSGCIRSGAATAWARRARRPSPPRWSTAGGSTSLYVNSFNAVARAAYTRVGFAEVGMFATILLD